MRTGEMPWERAEPTRQYQQSCCSPTPIRITEGREQIHRSYWAIEGLSCFPTASGFIYRKPWVFLTISFDNFGAFRCLNASVYSCSNRHGTLQKSSGSRTFYHQDGRGGQALYISVNKAHVFSSVAQLDVTNHQIPWNALQLKNKHLDKRLSHFGFPSGARNERYFFAQWLWSLIFAFLQKKQTWQMSSEQKTNLLAALQAPAAARPPPPTQHKQPPALQDTKDKHGLVNWQDNPNYSLITQAQTREWMSKIPSRKSKYYYREESWWPWINTVKPKVSMNFSSSKRSKGHACCLTLQKNKWLWFLYSSWQWISHRNFPL